MSKEKFQAIILCGGLGTRLREIVQDRPKPLALINERPFLDYLLHFLDKTQLIDRVVLAIAYKAELIKDYYQNHPYSFKIDFSIEKELKGTGGGIIQAMNIIDDEEFLVFNGDSLVTFNFGCFIEYVKQNATRLGMVITKVENVGRYGSICFDEQGCIISFSEKSADQKGSGYINAGVYYLTKEVFSNYQFGKAYSFERDILPSLIHKGIFGFKSDGFFIDIGTPESFKRAQEIMNFI